MAAATGREAQGGAAPPAEWRVSVPQGSSAVIESESIGPISGARAWLMALASATIAKPMSFWRKTWKIGADDPRKVVHGVKVSIALTLVSLFYYTRPLYDGVGGCAMWAVMTVVVVFEFTVGGCLYKGFNRVVATSTAGALAIGVHWIGSKSGEKMEPVVLSGSVFLLASAATFSRFMSNIKARFDYGITVFILTFSLVAVSGYRVDRLLQMAQQRVCTIFIGVSISFLVCILIRPIWAGQELHLLVSRNMVKLADSLDGAGLAEDCFAKGSNSTRSQAYKCVLSSKGSEDSQANLARWEPGHGGFRFLHPWGQYLRVGAAMRRCACCIEALDASISSNGIPTPAAEAENVWNQLREACLRLSTEAAKVLRELSSSVVAMKESPKVEFLVGEMEEAVRDLRFGLRSLPECLTECSSTPSAAATATTMLSLMDVMPMVAAAGLLVEMAERVGGVVDEVGVLAKLAGFEPATDRKKLSSSSSSSIAAVPQSVEPSRAV